MPATASQKKQICFVVQGFGEKTDLTDGRKLNLDASYQVIKEAVEEAGLKCLRADEIIHSGTIDEPMYEQILRADLVIADLSTYNVNAAYELGIRYGLRPYATIIVAEDKFKNPFDVSHIVIRHYKHLGEDIGVSEARRFKNELKAAISEIIEAQNTDSPVYTFLKNLKPPVEQKSVMPSAIAPPAPGSQNNPQQSVKEMSAAAREAMNNGDFALAKMLLQPLCTMRPNDDYFLQQLALATYKSKQPDQKTALEEAVTILKRLHPESTNDPETLGLWGAVHKRLWEITGEPLHLDESICSYERGFYLKQDYYNGINLAFLLNLRAALEEKIGEYAEAVADFIQARRIRSEVLRICEKALDEGTKSVADKYWILATMWEAAVGLEDGAAAEKWKQEATKVSPEGWMLETTQSQLGKLKGLLSESPLKHLQA
jgi:hypothetical protein